MYAHLTLLLSYFEKRCLCSVSRKCQKNLLFRRDYQRMILKCVESHCSSYTSFNYMYLWEIHFGVTCLPLKSILAIPWQNPIVFLRMDFCLWTFPQLPSHFAGNSPDYTDDYPYFINTFTISDQISRYFNKSKCLYSGHLLHVINNGSQSFIVLIYGLTREVIVQEKWFIVDWRLITLMFLIL